MSRADEPFDPVQKPQHYNVHPSGLECVELARLYNFCLGNAIKYLWRQGQKNGESNEKDLGKAAWYIQHELHHGTGQHVSGEVIADRHRLCGLVTPHHSSNIAQALTAINEAACATHPTWRLTLLESALGFVRAEIAERGKADSSQEGPADGTESDQYTRQA